MSSEVGRKGKMQSGNLQKRRYVYFRQIHASISRAERRLEALSNEETILRKRNLRMGVRISLKTRNDAKVSINVFS